MYNQDYVVPVDTNNLPVSVSIFTKKSICNGTSFSPIMYHCSRTGFINDIVIRPRYRTQLFLHMVDQLKIEGFSCYCAFPHLVLTDPSFQLQRASTHNTCTLCRLFSDTEKHSGDFIFTIVAPDLDGYLACSELIDYLAVQLSPFTTASLDCSSLVYLEGRLRSTRTFLVFPRRHDCSIFATHWAITLFSNVYYTSSLYGGTGTQLPRPNGRGPQFSLSRVPISGV